MKAIRYRNLDEARAVLREFAACSAGPDIFDDSGREPQGLLSVICEDQVPEAVFYRLFEAKKGVLVEVEKIPYSGYGPPAEEEDYMGLVSLETAYVLQGCRLSIEIEECPLGARDIHHLGAMVADGEHPIDRDDLAVRLRLVSSWDFDDLFDLILEGKVSAEEIDLLIHRALQ